jgi:predicted ATP-dependent endonuclease of OLD family
MIIRMKNFLAIKDEIELNLNRVNLFIGANNCGKSTFAKLQNLTQKNYWRTQSIMDNLSHENDISIIPSLSFHDYDVYFDLGNVSNDTNENQDITLSFERQMRDVNFKLILEFSPDSRETANQGVGNQKAASMKRFELLANNNLLAFQSGNSVKLNFAEIFRALFVSKFIDELGVSRFVSDFENAKNQFINHGKKVWEYNSDDVIYSSEEVFMKYQTEHRGNRMCYTLSAELINSITAQLLMPLRNINVISDQTSTRLDQESFWKVNDFLNDFGLSLEHVEAVPRNDGEVLPKIMGLQWLLKQHGQIRLAGSFGSGTSTLLSYLKRIAHLSTEANAGGINDLVLIEEPERNLHPDWQIKFMELILANLKVQRIIVETHSIYLLRVLQLSVLKNLVNPGEITIHEFYRDNNDVVRVSPITIDKNGMLSRDFYGGFNSGLLNLEKELWLRQQGRIKAN